MNSSSKASHDPAIVRPITRKPSLSRRLVLDTLSKMTLGHLRLEFPEGGGISIGNPQDTTTLPHGISSQAVIHVRREAFFRKCVLAGDVGFGESFVDGDWETPDLTAVIAWFIHNVESAPTLSGSKRSWRDSAVNLLRGANRISHLLRPNSRATARRNIEEHYDLSNEFFALFLDPSMMYSGARWPTPDLTLAEAQTAKNDILCQRLQLKPTDRVLEIGSGWGGWSMHAARTYGCHVTTLTISQQQYDLATTRIAAAGLADKIDVVICDYRDVTGTFDKIVSIEMMEAIGHQYLPAFCESLSRLLKRDGLLALQFITCPDDRYNSFRQGVDYIQKHIFPGSLLLSLNRVNDQLARAGGFVLNSVEDFGSDYTRTLRHWRAAFTARLDEVKALGFDERFIRKWTYYLHYCEAAFGMRNISVVHTLHTRANNLTR
ncbi:SAM-dependent methyltransferase [Synoicihabitans lomoniglobus]|uniref:Cyclopropane-fatty-acyl-phospholipid synthase n=1 Tax=Synoicihabitans lomoniglobus TaxID=2909285 RepID=A0AAF0CN47_9BACT|nr:cyclopropane-fatty-acyl-phospholipid synthase family protein [Opitutaceae bacterium LMO-M01]WED63950.1 cyclopropane-fatty-acyl-phospholipid synthase [Opitutaceae bacterium LMO-M01]